MIDHTHLLYIILFSVQPWCYSNGIIVWGVAEGSHLVACSSTCYFGLFSLFLRRCFWFLGLLGYVLELQTVFVWWDEEEVFPGIGMRLHYACDLSVWNYTVQTLQRMLTARWHQVWWSHTAHLTKVDNNPVLSCCVMVCSNSYKIRFILGTLTIKSGPNVVP